MPEYLSPGVYIEEVPAGPVPIEGVSTSTAGMVGLTERGPVAPRLVTSWIEYERWFGGHVPFSTSLFPRAVQGFFDNGGRRLFVARVHKSDAAEATLPLGTADPAQTLVVTALGAGEWGNRVFVRVDPPSDPRTPNTFRLRLIYYSVLPPLPLVDPFDLTQLSNTNRRDPDVVEDFDLLGIDPVGAGYVVTTVNAVSKLVQVAWSAPATPPGPSLPAFAAPPGPFTQLAGGGDGVAPLTATEYLGDPALPPDQWTGLIALEAIDDIALLAIPDEVHPQLSAANQSAVTNAVVDQCERLKDRFAVLAVNNTTDPGTLAGQSPPRDTSYGAIYYPWIRVFDPLTTDTLLVSSQGHLLGIYARTDEERGVHKAPANAGVRGIITIDLSGTQWPVQYKVTKGQQDLLNPKGFNVIRDFRSARRGIRVWGARTMSSDGQWKYINVRRLFIFLEESIDKGTQWVVFEGNYEATWARVVQSVSNFLTSVWRDGALAGTSPEEAFFVRCDRTTMTQDDIDNGRLICLIGVAPVKPAEFVIFRISQKTIEAQQS